MHPLRIPLNYPSLPGPEPPSRAEEVVGVIARVMTREVVR